MTAFAAPHAAFYVATTGNDGWTGKLAAPNAAATDGPFATLDRARRAVRELKTKGKKPVTVLIRGGTYELSAPVVFEPGDSGTAKAPVMYAAFPGETPVLSGGTRIAGWTVTTGGRWEAKLASPWDFSQLWVGGTRRFRPRLPREGTFYLAGGLPPSPAARGVGFDRVRVFPGDVPELLRPGEVEVCVFHKWVMPRMRIGSLDRARGVLPFAAPFGVDQDWAEFSRGDRYFLDNVREALGAPGDWYLDAEGGTITYVPLPGEAPDSTEVVAPRLPRLLELRGDPAAKAWVRGLEFRGLTLAHTNWTCPPEGHGTGQAEVDLGGAVTARGARDCAFTDCTVVHTGEYGLELVEGCRNVAVTRCVLADLGGGGIKIGTFRWGSSGGPETETGWITVRDCALAHGGRMHPAAVGILIGHSPHNTIDHDDIDDFFYTGISVGWSWGYGPSAAHHNAVTANRVGGIGQEKLSDMGGIYTLGTGAGNVVRDNVFHDIAAFDYGGWGIYFDEGSTGMVAERNLVYRTKSAGFHQHYGRDNIVRNNIFAYGTEAVLMRTRAEPHRSFTLERNLVVANGSPLLGSNWSGTGYAIDRNLYWDEAGPPAGPRRGVTWDQWRAAGHDRHSIVADPGFRDPGHGDFRLKPGSPAAKIGFKAFDTSKAGRRGGPIVPEAGPVFPWPAARHGVLPVSEDFEDSEPGEKASGLVTFEDEGATARVTEETAASGKRSLLFVKAANQPQPHDYNPHAYWEPGFTSGEVSGRFSVRLAPGATFAHEWRDTTGPGKGGSWYRVGPSLYVGGDGVLQANGKRLDALPANAWVAIEIRYTLGTATYTMTVTPPGGRVLRYADLACTEPIAKLTWWGFMALGTRPGPAFFLDDVSLAPASKP